MPPSGLIYLLNAPVASEAKELNVDPKNPKDENRDRFVLSKGHVAPALYSTLAEKGFFPKEDLTTLRHTGSYLQGHPYTKKYSAKSVDAANAEIDRMLKRGKKADMERIFCGNQHRY